MTGADERTVSARRVAGTVAGAAAVIAIVTVLSRVLGLGRWLVFSHAVGGTCVGEAYATANQLPNVLYEVAAGGALAAVVIPLVSSALDDGDERRADRLASALLSWAVVVLVPLALLLALLAGPIAHILLGGGGHCPGQDAAAADMVRFFAPQVVLYGIGIVLAGTLQAHRRFVAAALAPVLSSIVVMLAYLGYSRHASSGGATLTPAGLWWLAGGTTAGVIALSLPLLVPVWRAGIRLRPTLGLLPQERSRAVGLAAGGLVALLAQQAAVVATVWLADHRGTTGTINAYNYLQAVYLLPYAVLAVPIATSAFPRLTDRGGADTLGRTIGPVVLAGALGAALVAGLSTPVGAFFTALDAGRHGPGRSAMDALAPAMVAFAPGLLGFCVSALALRALYARGEALQGGLAMAGGWVISAGAPYLMTSGRSAHATLVALGIGSSLGMTAGAVALVVLVRRGWGAQVVAGLTGVVARLVPVALAAGLAGVLLGRLWEPVGLWSACGATVVDAIVVVGVFGAGAWLAVPAQTRAVVGRLNSAGGRR